MDKYREHLAWIDARQGEMVELVKNWSAINSGSRNMDGLSEMFDVLSGAFSVFDAPIERLSVEPARDVDGAGAPVSLPHGDALRLVKRAQAPIRVLLTGHMDTVFPAGDSFQAATMLDDDTLNGPGVADMKGGLIVMLHALRALEQSPWAEHIGFEVLINADEEVSSIGSAPLLAASAERAHFALVYEPSLPDGSLAGARKGSANYSGVARGKAAHAGREHHLGRNALVAIAKFTTAIDALNGQHEGVTINPAKIEGGGPNNVVPDVGVIRFNVRVADAAGARWIEDRLAAATQEINALDGVSFELAGGFSRPPKPMTPQAEALFEAVRACGADLGVDIAWHATGGCCDGNNLAAAGLPVVDTLGVRGGAIHSHKEFVKLSSFAERAKLSALLLMKIASGDIALPGRGEARS